MRLTEKESRGLVTAITTVLGPTGWELFLHGSRTDDKARGGDIDLLLLCSSQLLAHAKEQRRKIFVAIEDKIGERRVDLTTASLDPREQSEFVASALSKAAKLSGADP